MGNRLLLGCVLLVLGLALFLCLRDWLLCLPGFIAGGFLAISGGKLFLRATSGEYLCLQGVCREIEKHRRILIDVDGKRIQIPVGRKEKHLAVGDTLLLYLLPDTPLYEQDGFYRVFAYIALERLSEKD